MVNAFTLFGEVRADTSKLQRSLTDAERRLKSTQDAISKTEKEADKFGGTSATAARQYEKLSDGLALSKTRLSQAAIAFNRGEISAKQMTSEINRANMAAIRFNSTLKDKQARMRELATQATTSFATNIGFALGTAATAATAMGFKFNAAKEQALIAFKVMLKD